jgi:hypothetical protein
LLNKDFRATLMVSEIVNMRNVKLAIAILFLILAFESLASAQEIRERLPVKFDEFSGFNCEDAKARLDNFAINLQLQRQSDQHGFAIVYGGSRGRRGETQAWIRFVKEYLSDTRGIPAQRLTVLDGGYQKLLTMELWLLPKDMPPTPYPTVRPKDVKFKRGRILKRVCTDE